MENSDSADGKVRYSRINSKSHDKTDDGNDQYCDFAGMVLVD